MKQDIITKIETTYIPDGTGGYTEETREIGSYDVKLGVSKDKKKATAYGVQCEQMLEVVADEPMACHDGNYWIIIGQQGPQGIPGPVGPQGPKGADGTMTFEDLTPEQKESLRGPQGIQGEKGADGAPGAKGDQGIQGPEGPAGPKGDTGAQGPAGANYTITTADYDAIANVVYGKMTNAEQVRY